MKATSAAAASASPLMLQRFACASHELLQLRRAAPPAVGNVCSHGVAHQVVTGPPTALQVAVLRGLSVQLVTRACAQHVLHVLWPEGSGSGGGSRRVSAAGWPLHLPCTARRCRH